MKKVLTLIISLLLLNLIVSLFILYKNNKDNQLKTVPKLIEPYSTMLITGWGKVEVESYDTSIGNIFQGTYGIPSFTKFDIKRLSDNKIEVNCTNSSIWNIYLERLPNGFYGLIIVTSEGGGYTYVIESQSFHVYAINKDDPTHRDWLPGIVFYKLS